MNKNIIGVVLILAGIGIALYNWAYKKIEPIITPPPAVEKKIAPSPTPVSKPAPAPVTTTPPAPAFTSNIQVSVRGFAFVSESVQVRKGTKITWTNFDTAGHTITSDNGAFTSKILSQGKSFEYIFNTPGKYTYHCALHPYMKGEIVVSE